MNKVKNKTGSLDFGTNTSGNTTVDQSSGLVGLTDQLALQLAQDKPCRNTFTTTTPALQDIQKTIFGLNEYSRLLDASPMPSPELDRLGTEYYINMLFPENRLLSLGSSLRRFRTANRDDLLGSCRILRYIVPAYMTATSGMTSMNHTRIDQVPHLSPRCNANTGHLRYVVFRKRNVGLNDQAQAIIRLSRRYRLGMVVRANHSLIEAWFPTFDWPQDRIRELQTAAIRLGASRWTKIACKHYATPGSGTHYRHRQPVIYFDPSVFHG